MRKITLLLFAFLWFFNSNAQNSKTDDIRELMEYTGMDKVGDQIVNEYISVNKTDYGENIPGLWDTINVVLNEGLSGLLDSIVLIYDKVYTHDEIKSMMEIYQTPIGKKMIETMPLITKLSMQAGENWASENMKKIKDRIAPLVEKYSKKEYAYDGFYNPNEKYDYDIPKVVVDSKSNNEKVQGGTDYKYYINYNSRKWDKVSNESINPIADLTFITKNQDTYALIMAETSKLTIQQLKASAIYYMSGVYETVNIKSIGLRNVNGKEMLCMKISIEIQGEVYKYYNYYYSGDWGTIQFIVFATNDSYEKNLNNIEELLSGLYVE